MACLISSSSVAGLLRQAAPTITRRPFSSCARLSSKSSFLRPAPSTNSYSQVKPQFKSIRNTPFLQAFRSRSTAAPNPPAPFAASLTGLPTSFNGSSAFNEYASGNEPTASTKQTASSFPQVSGRHVAWWLLASAASVFGIVVFGALTRLTESGLSITEWRPVTGTLPPMSQADWDTEFQKYRASPEYERLNPNMDLAAFKEIFWMEYIHRLWGRTIGLTFLLPTIYFIARRRVSKPIARNLMLISGLIGLQGFVGWWMVKSGLTDDLFAIGAYPRVSQYRLAAHLGLAFTVYVSMLWNALSIFREHKYILSKEPAQAIQSLNRLRNPKLRTFRVSLFALAALIFTTAMSGAFVAGLDAGLIYNEFPYMGLGLAPPKSELWNPFYSRLPPPHDDLWWRNMFENPSLVQLDHRILATTTFTAVHALFFYSRFSRSVSGLLGRGAKRAIAASLSLVWLQALMGIGTLLYLVPTSLAAAHQAGSLALLSSVVILGSRVWTTPRLARLVRTLPRQGAPNQTRHDPKKSFPLYNHSRPQ